MRILFDPRKEKFKKPFGALRENEHCSLSLFVPVSCPSDRITVVFEQQRDAAGGVGISLRVPMEKRSNDGDYAEYSADFSLFRAGLYFYYFLFESSDGKEAPFRLFRSGFSDTNIEDGSRWQLTCYPASASVPEAFRGKVTYQIFPDRFARSESVTADLSAKLSPFVLHQSTSEPPGWRPDEKGEVLCNDFFGGNLRGIEEKLPYLSSLGVEILYLNPICKAFSNHRYDTADYRTVDPLLGDENDFVSLCDSAHRLGMKLILDGVFSHTGSDSIYFDAKHRFGHGAVSDPEHSPYRSWYRFSHFPDAYDCWWGIRTLPCVNKLDDSYLDFIIRGEDSVIAHWLRLGCDGFRLDVADELPDKFIALLKQRMRQLKPESFLIGEVWEDASNKVSYGGLRRYFTSDELDTTMNYPFRTAILNYVRGLLSPEAFADAVMTILENYPPQSAECLLNSLSTHDTPRALSELSGVVPDSKEERAAAKLSPEQRALALKRLRMAVILQFALPGNPCIYYGDEIGMEGYEDPFNRAFFDSENADIPLTDFFRSCAELKKRPALTGLKTDFSFGEDGLLRLIRRGENEELRIIANNTFADRSLTDADTGRVILSSSSPSSSSPDDRTVESGGWKILIVE